MTPVMTNRWINVVLAVVVVAGLAGVYVYEQPRLAEERAELVGQDVTELDEERFTGDPDRALEGLEGLRAPEPAEPDTEPSDVDPEPTPTPARALNAHGVTSSNELAVRVGTAILDAGGNAVDAAVAVAYALGVAEPFGSGVGGGGAMLVHEAGEEPVGYDYREVAPYSGELPASNIGVPGFVAGMAHVHERHGSLDMATLIDPAISLAENGFAVDVYLQDRLRAAAHRLPINRIPNFFPRGGGIPAGETLVQPDYADALRLIRDEGPDVMYGGALGQRIADEVSGLDLADFEAYEVIEVAPTSATLNGYTIHAAGPPLSGPTVLQTVLIADALGAAEADPRSAEYHHALSQAFRLAMEDRTERITDPTVQDVDDQVLVADAYIDALAAIIPDDGFVDAEQADDPASIAETDTTHVVVVDREGTMVSMTNTLSNFFGSGLVIDGFFLNDQLKNFSRDADSINLAEPGKRPRSFIAPVIVADEDGPVLGLGSPGGRRIPMMIAQVLYRWAVLGQDLDTAVAAPRFHLEGRRLYAEELGGDAASTLQSYGYERTPPPVTEFYGGIQALEVVPDNGSVKAVADERRDGAVGIVEE